MRREPGAAAAGRRARDALSCERRGVRSHGGAGQGGGRGVFRTAARAQVVLFADAWGFDTQQIAVPESSNMKTYAELDQAG